MGRLRHWLSSGAWHSRIARLAVLLGAIAAADQLLSKFQINLAAAAQGNVLAFALGALSLFLLVELVFFPRVVERQISISEKDGVSQYCESLLTFANALIADQKHSAVLRLREANSHLLHLLGRSADRVALGRLALSSALARRSVRDRMAILIDDLGWTLHELGDEAEAKGNIERALALPSQVEFSGDRERLELSLLALKGLRHLAVLDGRVAAENEHLRSAKALAQHISQSRKIEGTETEITRDLAQLKHAEAMLIFENMQQRFGRKLRPDDAAAAAAAKEALSLAEAALASFEEVGDDERAAKALDLMQRLFDSLDRKTEALEAHARMGRVLRTIPARGKAHG